MIHQPVHLRDWHVSSFALICPFPPRRRPHGLHVQPWPIHQRLGRPRRRHSDIRAPEERRRAAQIGRKTGRAPSSAPLAAPPAPDGCPRDGDAGCQGGRWGGMEGHGGAREGHGMGTEGRKGATRRRRRTRGGRVCWAFSVRIGRRARLTETGAAANNSCPDRRERCRRRRRTHPSIALGRVEASTGSTAGLVRDAAIQEGMSVVGACTAFRNQLKAFTKTI